MKRLATFALLSLTLGAAVPWPRASAATEPVVLLNRIVAVVNDGVIVQSELDQRVRQVAAELRQAGTPLPPQPELVKQVLQRLILEHLQLQLAKRQGITVDDQTLNQAMEDIARRNHVTLREYRQILERGGFSYRQFRERIRDELIIQKLRRRDVADRVVVTPQDVDDYLATRRTQGETGAQYHIAQILIALPEAPSAQAIASARQRMEKIVADLKSGANFAQTAVAVSDGQRALEGGDLGWVRAAALPPSFARELHHMHPGELSGILRTPGGFHVIKLLGVRGVVPAEVDQVRLREILIRTGPMMSNEQARERLEQLRSRIANGASFAELARANSADRESAIHGGDLGWQTLSELPPVFQQEIRGLARGQVSQPFQTPSGWLIVQVEARRKFADAKAAARQEAMVQLRTRKYREALDNWLRQLREEAYVRIESGA